MFKNDFDGTGIKFICEHCKTIVATNFNFNNQLPTWERIQSKNKGKGSGKGRILDFCNEKCRIVYLRGRKYYADKLEHIKINWEREIKRMDGN